MARPSRLSRRQFARLGFVAAAAALAACGGDPTRRARERGRADGASGAPGDGGESSADGLGVEADGKEQQALAAVETFDYVVVGSGAGGGPVACNLARAGFRVLLLEAGSGDTKAAKANYDVPALHPFASEDPALAWRYFVRHGRRDNQDTKFVKSENGVFYPRGSTLGGSTAVNAMITMVPHERDWRGIASMVRDTSWEPQRMRSYERQVLEGWLPTEQASPALLFQDPALLRLVSAAVTKNGILSSTAALIGEMLDPNAYRGGKHAIEDEGVFNPRLATLKGRRRGAREYILATKAHATYGKNLTVVTDALATAIVLDDSKKAVAVEFQVGKSLYGADPRHKRGAQGKAHAAKVTREVIVSAGAFNTPQLLKLSGIGPAAELERHGIAVKVDLPGVGANLQDRLEVGVVSELKNDVQLTKDCTFGAAGDPCLTQHAQGRGPYASNGTAIGVAKKSKPGLSEPDLFVFGLPTIFKGYYPGYSRDIAGAKRHFSWVILKGHTKNDAGRVTLRSADPTDTPTIDFRSYADGSDQAGEDTQAVVEGIKTARELNARSNGLNILPVHEQELVPGKGVQGDAALRDFVEREAWGHHASCSCKMGPASDEAAVVGSDFKVHKVKGLRVVDASIFPRIPGLFIALPTYMIAQKASEAILADAGVTDFDSLDFEA